MTQHRAKRVAVIGAGISGVSSAAHLLRQGLDVVLFERSGVAGGVWHFDPRSTKDPSYPNELPSKGDYETKPESAYSTPPPESDDKEGDVEIAHAPPGPCYSGLKNNVSTRLMRTSLQSWPTGTEDFVTQKVLEEYIQALAEDHGVSSITQYHTRVEEVRKSGFEWLVRTTSLEKTALGSHLLERRWTFDAVVVASGHYNMPRIPEAPGLKQWKEAFPERVWHSKRYRNPRVFQDQNILLIGAGVSSCDIAKESAAHAKHIFQSSRGGVLDLPATFLPKNATRIPGIKSFELDASHHETKSESDPIPGKIILENGEELSDVHAVILCTGYITSYPFLAHLHSDTTPTSQADESVLVTAEGDMVHNLHKDIFYIEDPSLVFVGAPYHIATFSLFDFQAQVVARVLSGKASLPTHDQMREEYRARVEAKGLGRDFHSLRGEGEEQAYVAELVDWTNRDAAGLGVGDKMRGHTEEWHEANRDREEKLKWLRATKDQEKKKEAGFDTVAV
ncbi:dimethylaniline monooxygenase (N-oxide forming) [Exophiala viscosa]|uniref:Dimethylaniline monooxygenase (N-oxide forming) n=1 Tax=Exophiala viscosa TaxID=2486360 RepID=A0AAN6DPV3_9EURO|nr:dimethylaniline monooxygenase (N-oxide forming) [Exophiala viscosa]KAI1620996.1 dimethylaniline monooxygenase (N-oxide forming) [Exophiala viscosa]